MFYISNCQIVALRLSKFLLKKVTYLGGLLTYFTLHNVYLPSAAKWRTEPWVVVYDIWL